MGIPNNTDDLLNPRQAATLLGVHAASVKRWSDQGRLRCIRTAGGHRRFLRRDVEALRTSPSAQHPHFVEQLWAVASAGEQMTTEGMLLDYWGQMGRWELVSDAIGTLLTAVDRAPPEGQMPIPEKHAGKPTLLGAMARLLAMMPVPSTAPMCALATVPDDLQTIGLAMSELVLAEHHWQSLRVGSDRPVETMIDVMKRPEVTMLALSASQQSSSPPVLYELLVRLAPVARATGTQLVVGGTGAWPNETPHAHRTRTFRDFGLFLRGQVGVQRHHQAV